MGSTSDLDPAAGPYRRGELWTRKEGGRGRRHGQLCAGAGCVAASCGRVRRWRGQLRVGDDGEAGGGITGAVSFCAAWTRGDRRGRQTDGATGAGL